MAAKGNKTEVTLARAHLMHTRWQKEEISVIVQDALLSRLNSVIEHSYHCISQRPRQKKELVSPSQSCLGRPRVGLPVRDLYKYLMYPETSISE